MSVLRRGVTRAYALALWAFPRAHRAEYQAEMIESFDRELATLANDHGRRRALGFAVAACLNVVGAGLGERRRHRRTGQARARGNFFAGFGGDLTYAVRALAKARTFSIVCVVSLGLGLGVVFSISMFLRQLLATPPGVDADGLVEVVVNPLGPHRAQVGSWAIETWSYPDFEDLRDADTGMAVTGWAIDDGILRSPSLAPQRTSTMYVSANYFTAVGVVPAQGRIFNAADEDESSAQPVLVVSHRLWENRLGADPDIIGSMLTLNRVEHVVIGVAPDGFRGHLNRRAASPADLWVPLREHPALAFENGLRRDRGADWLRVFARLSPGTSLGEANGAVSSVMSGLAEQYPTSNEYKAASVEPYTSTGTNQQLENGIITVMFYGMSGMVLVVVCLNVAGMVLVRSATREPELAMRQALGASRSRLMRHLMSEAVVLALAGGSLSAAVVYGGSVSLSWWFEGPVPDALRLNPSKVAVCIALSLATTLVFGLLPAIRFSRTTMVMAIKDDTGVGGWRVGRVHRLAAALQVGIALPFLIMGGLLFDGARTAATADLGFEPDGLFASAISVAAAGYADEDAGFFLSGVQDNLRQASGVASVTVADGLPLDYNLRRGYVSLVGAEAQVRAHTKRVGEGYLTTLGTPLLRGRDITADDHAGAELVALLSESLATQLFPGGDALGGRVASALQGNEKQVFTVVGVTADVVTSQMQTTRPQIFVALAQHPAPRVFLIARSSADTQSMTTAFEEAIADLDPGFSRPSIVTGAALVRDNIGDLLEQSTLALAVAAVALTLSALGIYGVVAFMVAARTREMGVRIALGATRRRVVNTVLIDTCKLVVPGLAVGLLLAITWVRQTDLLWYRLGAVEPAVYALAAAAALAVALLASLPSAYRAAAVEPLDAIRSE